MSSIIVIFSIGLLVSSPLTGFALLKSYEDFCKGAERNSRLRMWSAFFGGSYLFMILISSIMRLVTKSSEINISEYLLTLGVFFPLAAIISGYILLRTYEIFREGKKKESRFQIWSAFLMGGTLFILSSFFVMKWVTI